MQVTKKRRALGPVETVLSIIIVGSLAAIAPFITGNLQLGLNTSGLPAGAQTAIGSMFTGIYNAYGILPLIVVVLALVGVLSVVFLLIPGRRGAVGAETV